MNFWRISNTPKKISRLTEVSTTMNCGLWLILNLAMNDSIMPIVAAIRNWMAKNAGMAY